jgi:hypothetical protein
MIFKRLGPEPTSFAINRTIGLTLKTLFARWTCLLTFNTFLFTPPGVKRSAISLGLRSARGELWLLEDQAVTLALLIDHFAHAVERRKLLA